MSLKDLIVLSSALSMSLVILTSAAQTRMDGSNPGATGTAPLEPRVPSPGDRNANPTLPGIPYSETDQQRAERLLQEKINQQYRASDPERTEKRRDEPNSPTLDGNSRKP